MQDFPVLYFAPETCARVTLTALEEIGAPFRTHLVAFVAGEHRAPDFLARNPAGKVPALETSEGMIVQNGAILSYLAETHPDTGLLPRRGDAIGRADVLAQLFRFSSDLHPLVTRFAMAAMMSTDEHDAPRIREVARQGLSFQLGALERCLCEQEWLLPEGWSVLDAYLAWVWFRITGAGFDRSAFPAIARHYARAGDRPSAKAALAREEEAQADLKRRGLHFVPPPFERLN